MTHEFACSLERSVGTIKLGTAKESDVDVLAKGVYVRKARIPKTRCWMAVVKKFGHVVAARTDHVEPKLGDFTQFAVTSSEPRLNSCVALHRARKSKKLGRAVDQLFALPGRLIGGGRGPIRGVPTGAG